MDVSGVASAKEHIAICKHSLWKSLVEIATTGRLDAKVEQMLSKDSKAAVAALVSRVADKPKKTRTVKVSTLQTEQPEKKSQREKKNQFNTSKHVSKTY